MLRCLTLIISCLLAISTSLAATTPSRYDYLNKINAWRGVVALGLGAAFSSHIGGSAFFPIRPPVSSQLFLYSPNRSTQGSALFDAFVGAELPIWPFNWQIGLGFKQAWNWNSHGSLLQGPTFAAANAFPYHYDILTRQVLVETKLLYELLKCYRPYILFAAGQSFNEATGFATIVPAPLMTRVYKDNTERSYTYMVGVGLDVNVLDYLRFGLGYRFGDLGQVQLGHARLNNLRVTGLISQNHLYVNEVLGQVTLLFA